MLAGYSGVTPGFITKPGSEENLLGNPARIDDQAQTNGPSKQTVPR